jgi:predicted DNA-binding transcriptional regulator YafY
MPIHESQDEVETTKEWSIFEYRLIPCYNFYQQLLWHREKLEVLEPLHVREEMKSTIESLCNIYK